MWGEGTPWKTQAEFYTYLRGCFRKAWMRHPNKIKVINARRFKVDRVDKDGNVMIDKKTGKPKQVWNCECEICGHKGGMKDFQVDHIHAAKQLQCFEDIPLFVFRLIYVKEEDLRMVCKLCNSILAYADKQGISFEEAKAEKEAIALCRAKKDKAWLKKRKIEPESTVAKRRKQIVKILLQEIES
ncbi:HNH endonuclease [Escherichia coli]